LDKGHTRTSVCVCLRAISTYDTTCTWGLPKTTWSKHTALQKYTRTHTCSSFRSLCSSMSSNFRFACTKQLSCCRHLTWYLDVNKCETILQCSCTSLRFIRIHQNYPVVIFNSWSSVVWWHVI
jgi:hypothetical protein